MEENARPEYMETAGGIGRFLVSGINGKNSATGFFSDHEIQGSRSLDVTVVSPHGLFGRVPTTELCH
jgi:hypothetical protein